MDLNPDDIRMAVGSDQEFEILVYRNNLISSPASNNNLNSSQDSSMLSASVAS